MPIVVPPATSAPESFILDGLSLNDGVLNLAVLDAPPPRQRQDWIGAADSEAQLLFRNPLHENRRIAATLVVTQTADMDSALDRIGDVRDKLAKASKTSDGIELTWSPAGSARTVTFDVLAGEITDLPIDYEAGWFARSPTIKVELTAKPYWRGTETLTSTASSSTPFVTTVITGVTGDVPALGRLIVTDTATQSRRHVEWGIEGQFYNAATSLLIDSDDMVTSGFAGAQATQAGSYDPNASGNNVISTSLYSTPVAAAGTGNLSHIGTFRVKARILTNATSTTATYVRLAWQVGDGPLTSNAWASHPVTGEWVEVDLGTVTIPSVVSGTQRWTGRVEAYTTVAGSTFQLDYLTLIPVVEGYGKARATYSYTSGVIIGQDGFTSTTAGNALNARVAPVGGTWATSGSATDLAFADDLGGEQLKRTTNTDAGPRWAILGSTNYTDVQVGTLMQRGVNLSGNIEQGVIARWTDSSNYLRATALLNPSGGGSRTFSIIKRVAGVDTTLATAVDVAWGSGAYYAVRVIVFASGRVLAWLMNASGAQIIAALDVSDSVLATAGTLATGKPGIYDMNTGTTISGSRYYDDFTVSTPAAEPIALYSGRNMQFRHDDAIRQDSTGTYTGRPQSYRGSRFLVPVGTSRVIVKARRNDIDTGKDDTVVDATQIQIGWVPRGLAVPR